MEQSLEAGLFWTRWLLAPAYFVLTACLAVLAWKVFEEFWQLIIGLQRFNETQAILQVLTIVDLVLVLNLVLMIAFVGYENFVSKVHPTDAEDWPAWARLLDYAGLKVQLLGSIIAITSIKMLREFVALIDVGKCQPRQADVDAGPLCRLSICGAYHCGSEQIESQARGGRTRPSEPASA